ncbi:MAG: hypothetical protein JW844_07310 [Candidatus Omnitrophica bacterium]|nr:hypothetical protein [Candidatus Omnitrophota bacterium]
MKRRTSSTQRGYTPLEKKHKKSLEGFTIVEIANIILLISIIAIIAIPKFISLADSAYEARGLGNVGALRAATYIFYAVTGLNSNLEEARFPETAEELEGQLAWSLEWEEGGGYKYDDGQVNP